MIPNSCFLLWENIVTSHSIFENSCFVLASNPVNHVLPLWTRRVKKTTTNTTNSTTHTASATSPFWIMFEKFFRCFCSLNCVWGHFPPLKQHAIDEPAHSQAFGTFNRGGRPHRPTPSVQPFCSRRNSALLFAFALLWFACVRACVR